MELVHFAPETSTNLHFTQFTFHLSGIHINGCLYQLSLIEIEMLEEFS